MSSGHKRNRRAALSTWIYRIAVNAALIKKRGKRAALEVLIEDCLPTYREDGHREGDGAWLQADWSDNPEAQLLSRETRDAVREMIERLPDSYRVVLLLRDVEELSYEATAQARGVGGFGQVPAASSANGAPGASDTVVRGGRPPVPPAASSRC